MKPSISIVMAYYTRWPQCRMTLRSLELSKQKHNLEVIIIDDGTIDEEHIIKREQILEFSFPIYVHHIPASIKNWKCPVIPFNYGLRLTRGDWVIIQNPECCHVGDICDFVLTSCDPDEYHTLSVCVSPSTRVNDQISESMGKVDQLLSFDTWYNHPVHNAWALHFCSAIHKNNLQKIGGFNNSMKEGIDWDDNEFLERDKRVVSKVNIWNPSDSHCFCIHLWHIKFTYLENCIKSDIWSHCPRLETLKKQNKVIFEQTKTNKKFVYANPVDPYLEAHENDIIRISNV